MASRGKTTVKFIEGLTPTEREYTRSKGDGITVRVFSEGRKVLFYYFTSPETGQRRKYRLGEWGKISLADANERRKAAERLVDKKIDPMEEERRQREQRAREEAERDAEPTVEDLADEFLKKYCQRFRKSWREDKRILEKDILPEWGTRKARDITKREVLLLVEDIGERGPVMANRTRSLLHLMFRFGAERDIVESSPVALVRRPFEEEKRDRHLSAEEIRTFWEGLDRTEATEEVKRALRLVLATACRPGEAVGLTWEEIEEGENWWNLPAARAKSGKAHRFYLNTVARGLLGNRPEEGGGPVFLSPAKGREGEPVTVRALSRVIRRSEHFGLEQFTTHDLRRTTATHLGRLGVYDHEIGQILGHTDRGITARYNRHSYDPERKKAMEKWGRELRRILEGKAAGRVVEFPGGKGSNRGMIT